MEQPLRVDPEQKYRTLYEFTSDAVMLLDEQSFFDCNPATLKMFGCATREQFLGKHPSEFSPEFQPGGETSTSLSQQRIETALREGTCRFEWQHCQLDGSEFPAEVWLTAIDIGGEKVLQAVVRDITERKRAEEESHAARQQLLDIIDFSPDATFVIDQDKKVIAWNRAAEEMTGTRKEDILGQGDYAYAIPWWGERRPMVIDLIGVEASEFKEKYDFVRKIGHNTLYAEVFVPLVFGGRGGYLAATAAPLLDSDGNMVGAIESVRDITDRKRLEKEIQESLERRGHQVQTSTEVAQEIAVAPALEDLFQRVVTLIKERFNYYHTQILRLDPDLDAMVVAEGYGEAGEKMKAARHHLPYGRGVVGTAAATGRPVLASDVSQDPYWVPNPHLPDTQGELAVPIKLRDQVLGILDVQSDRAGALTAEDQLLLEGLCGQIAAAMESTRLRQETEERMNELSALYRATAREGWQAYRETAQVAPGYLFDRVDVRPEDIWLPQFEQAIKQNTLVPPTPFPESTGEDQGAGVAVAPLSVRGEVIGVVGVYDNPQQPLLPDELALMQEIAEQGALALEGARLFEQAQNALREMEAAHRRYLQQAWTEYSQSSEATAYETPSPGTAPLGDRVLPEIRQAIQRQEATVLTGTGDDGGRASALVMPITLRGQVIGVLGIHDEDGTRQWTDDEIALVESVAERMALTAESLRLMEGTQRRAAREHLVGEVATRMRESLEMETLLRTAASEMRRALGLDDLVVRLAAPGTDDDPAQDVVRIRDKEGIDDVDLD